MKSALRLGAFLCVAWQLTGCAVLFKVQLSDIESSRGRSTPISVRVSETTVNLQEISAIAGGVARANRSRGLSRANNALETYTKLFQFGPRTGTPVYSEYYARDIPERLAAKCVGGRLSNITSVREAMSYPVVKGEIVRVDALCTKP